MSAVTRLRAAEFTVRLVQPNNIGIAPVERLTDVQRQWVTAHRDTLLEELRTEAAIYAASKITWQEFTDECVILGVSADTVATMFRQHDITDLCEEPTEKMPHHAQTIVDVIKRKRIAAKAKTGNTYTLDHAQVRSCKGCQHFNRIAHRHLGTCAAGEPHGIAGNWDTDSRDYCQSWQAVTS